MFIHIIPTDYFQQPSIYLAYQSRIIGPSALESTTLFAIYGLASGENKDFVTQVPRIYSLSRFMELKLLSFKSYEFLLIIFTI